MCSKCSKKAGGCDVLLCFFGLEPRNKCPLPGPPVTHSPGTPSDVEGPRHQGLSGFMPGRGCTCRVWSTAGVEHWCVIGMVAAQVFLPTSLGDLDSSLSKRVSGGHIFHPWTVSSFLGSLPHSLLPQPRLSGEGSVLAFPTPAAPLNTHGPGASLASLHFLKVAAFAGSLASSETAIGNSHLKEKTGDSEKKMTCSRSHS